MRITIDFYNETVYESFMHWPNKLKERFIRLVELIQEHGADLGMPHTQSLGNGLFELRVKGPEGIGRAFFCYAPNRRIIILYGFIKKTQKIPIKELNEAKKRQKEVENQNYEL